MYIRLQNCSFSLHDICPWLEPFLFFNSKHLAKIYNFSPLALRAFQVSLWEVPQSPNYGYSKAKFINTFTPVTNLLTSLPSSLLPSTLPSRPYRVNIRECCYLSLTFSSSPIHLKSPNPCIWLLALCKLLPLRPLLPQQLSCLTCLASPVQCSFAHYNCHSNPWSWSHLSVSVKRTLVILCADISPCPGLDFFKLLPLQGFLIPWSSFYQQVILSPFL